MGALLGDCAVVEDYDVVGVADRREAVGDDNHGAPAVETLEVADNLPLVAGVEGVGGFVEEDEAGVAVYGAGDEDSLLLPLTQPDAVGSDDSVVARRQFSNCIFLV